MNIEETSVVKVLLDAFVEGRQIQTAVKLTENWNDTNSPAWDFSRFNYRIKPETLRYRRCIRRHGDAYVDIVRDEESVSYVEGDVPGFVRWIDKEWQEETT